MAQRSMHGIAPGDRPARVRALLGQPRKVTIRRSDILGRKYEVVLVGADSIETIKRTHSPYFSTGTATQVVEDFIAAIR